MKSQITGNEKILEVGCGAGFLLNSVKKNFPNAKLFGIDLTEKLLEVAKKEQSSSISFQNGDATKIPFRDNEFDVLIFKNLLHHVVRETREDSKKAAFKALQEMKRVLKTGGRIFVYEETVSSEWKSNFLFKVSKLCLKLGIEIPPLYIHKYVVVSFLTKKEFLGMFRELGFEIESKEEFPLHIRPKYRLTVILPLFMHGTKDLKIVAKVGE